MELTERYGNNLAQFRRAIVGFANGLDERGSHLSERQVDLIRNGQVQKFEYCCELAWKTSKQFLEITTGQVYASPKPTYKALFQEGYIGEALLGKLLNTIEGRNTLSHIYREETFELIHKELPQYAQSFEQLLRILTAHSPS